MSRAPIAIRRRLELSVLGLLSVVYGTLILNTELVIQRDRLQRHQRLVMATAAAIEAQLAPRGSAPPSGSAVRAVLNDFSASRVLVWLSRPGGQAPIFPQSASTAEFFRRPALLQAAGVNAAGMQPPRSFRFGTDTYYTCSMPLASGQGVLRFLEDVGVSPASRNDNLLTLLGIWLGLVLISALLLKLLLRQAIQPLQSLEQAVDQVGLAPCRRLPPLALAADQQPQELQGIVAAYNRLVQRLQQAWDQQQLLVHALSHELITPLSLIAANTARLQRHATALPAADQKLLAAIREEAGSSERLVRDLLDLARGESGRLQLSPEAFEPFALLDQLVQDLRPLPWGERVQWGGAQVGGEPRQVSGDPERFRQCVLNLLENAAKYAPPGSPIQLIPALTAERFVLSIQDQGPGIPAAERERVFEPFTRLPQAAEQGPGAGIGLAVVRLLMEQMQGTVKLVPGSGVGTCLQLTMPLVPPAVVA